MMGEENSWGLGLIYDADLELWVVPVGLDDSQPNLISLQSPP